MASTRREFMKLAGLGAAAWAVGSRSPADAAPPVNRDAFGVWAKTDRYEVTDFPYRGAEVGMSWSEVEPSDGGFDWSAFDAGLEKTARLGLYSFIDIGVGFEGPTWLYDKGIPKITTDHRTRTGPYPYYLDARYVSYYHRLIENFGRHARALPPRLADRILFVQVKTGATGDETPYKGTPTPAQYAISGDQWGEFRLAAFRKFNAAFQEGPGRVIPLLFNGLFGDKPRLDWVKANVKGGWGHKEGGYGQCYQLNDEAERAEDFIRHLIDPDENDYEFFTRCEMDQGWKEGIFAPNIRMGFYWTGLSALHGGLGVWNLSKTAWTWCSENKYWEFAHFFNKYAGQTRSPSAAGAFCALRDGLDSADTVKFPEARYGTAARDNRQRYMAVCGAYAQRGAKMDDPDGVLAGQVRQRTSQKGLNDAGWLIFPGNYERFLRQIDPDKTSVGWWRVGGQVTPAAPVYGRFARGFDHAGGKDAMYFDIKDSFFSGGPLKGACPVTVRIVYYDRGTGRWALRYDAVDDPGRTACVVTETDSGTWKEKTVTLADANFGNRGERGADLVLAGMDAQDHIFHMVEVTRGPRT
jgi:hypothetical protein